MKITISEKEEKKRKTCKKTELKLVSKRIIFILRIKTFLQQLYRQTLTAKLQSPVEIIS